MATRFTNSDFTTAARKLGEKVFKDKEQVVEKEVKQFADNFYEDLFYQKIIGLLFYHSNKITSRNKVFTIIPVRKYVRINKIVVN